MKSKFIFFIILNILIISNICNCYFRTSLRRQTVENAIDIQAYKIYSYKEINQQIQDLLNKYKGNNLIKVESAQQLFNISSVGKCDNQQCISYIVTITNFNQAQEKLNSLPQILISGEIHGDERVGPNVAIELIRFLLTQYVDKQDPWIQYLVNNRKIVIIPMANAQGYANNHREEKPTPTKILDPNRDFPYLESNCLKTTAAQILYNLYKNNVFQLSITFHAGEHSISYPWGGPNHKIQLKQSQSNGINDLDQKSTEAPDTSALDSLVRIFEKQAPKTKDIPQYVIGPMNSVVYDIIGGMEDWSYAAGWENQISKKTVITQCQNLTAQSKQNKYQNENIRSAVFLIETSDDKTPKDSTLGKVNYDCLSKFSSNPFYAKLSTVEQQKCISDFDGHISRNMRICLSMIDLAAPYIQNIQTKSVNTSQFQVQYSVGGAFKVNQTRILYTTTQQFQDKLKKNLEYSKMFKLVNSGQKQGEISQQYEIDIKYAQNVKNIKKIYDSLLDIFGNQQTPIQQGIGQWNLQNNEITRFTQSFNKSGSMTFLIMASTDQDLGKQTNPDPKTSPQTHYVKQLIDEQYYRSYNDGLLQYEQISYKYIFSNAFQTI